MALTTACYGSLFVLSSESSGHAHSSFGAHLYGMFAAFVLRVANADSSTRVHLFASRYLSPYDSFAELQLQGLPYPDDLALGGAESIYASGRSIGDEYRYILDRRLQTIYPGNMLARPGLLLNPWAIEKTESEMRARTFLVFHSSELAFYVKQSKKARLADISRRHAWTTQPNEN